MPHGAVRSHDPVYAECMPSPRTRASRRAGASAGAAGLALAAVVLSGCAYPAASGSSVVTYFPGCGPDETQIILNCTTLIASRDAKILDDKGRRHAPATSRVTAELGGAAGTLAMGFFEKTDGGHLVWAHRVTWPTSPTTAGPPIRQRVESVRSGVFNDYWILDRELPVRGHQTAPVASLFSHDSPAARDPAPTTPTILDARQSTGTGLTYSWDTDGDRMYGDDPQGGWTGVPAPAAGTAYIPSGALTAAALTPAVRVTDTETQTDVAQVDNLPTWADGAGGLAVAAGAGGQISLLPAIGTLPTGSYPVVDVHYACIDIGGDGTYDTVEPLVYIAAGVRTGFPDYLTALWTGPKRVRVAFFADSPTPLAERGTCTNPAPGALVLSTHTELVNGATRTAMEQGGYAKAKVTRYTATARVRLTGGTLIAPGTQAGTSVRGVLNRGRYTLRTPARAHGRARPAGLAAFASGDFASRSDATLGFTGDGRTTLEGTTTMVIRGTGRALACLTVAQTDSSTTWTAMGGTGVARTLRMTMTGGPTLNRLVTTAVPVDAKVTGTGRSAVRALSPVSTRYTVNAATGAGRGMSTACRALVKRLP